MEEVLNVQPFFYALMWACLYVLLETLPNFLEVSNTINPSGTTLDDVRLRLFPFSLLGKAKTWFYSNTEAFTTWESCSNALLAKYFPVGKTNAPRNRITRIKQLTNEKHPGSLGTSTGVHSSMPTPRHRRVADDSELLPWRESASPGPC